MKRLLIILGLTLLSAPVINAQDLSQAQVPANVMEQFMTAFPDAKDIEWEMRGASGYEVEFETGWGRDHEAWLNSDGATLYHREDIRNRELPETVQNRIASDFDGYRIDDAVRITEPNQVTYELSLESRRLQDLDVVVSSDGDLIRQAIDD